MQHHPLIRSLRLRPHARLGLETTSTLPRSDYPKPKHLQAQRHDADGNAAGRDTVVLRSLRGNGESLGESLITVCHLQGREC